MKLLMSFAASFLLLIGCGSPEDSLSKEEIAAKTAKNLVKATKGTTISEVKKPGGMSNGTQDFQ